MMCVCRNGGVCWRGRVGDVVYVTRGLTGGALNSFYTNTTLICRRGRRCRISIKRTRGEIFRGFVFECSWPRGVPSFVEGQALQRLKSQTVTMRTLVPFYNTHDMLGVHLVKVGLYNTCEGRWGRVQLYWMGTK